MSSCGYIGSNGANCVSAIVLDGRCGRHQGFKSCSRCDVCGKWTVSKGICFTCRARAMGMGAGKVSGVG